MSEAGQDFDLSSVINLASSLETPQVGETERVLNIDPSKTRDNPYQPRKERNPVADAELAESVGTQGVQQPAIVLPATDDGVRTIVFGHRRRDAAVTVGCQLPVIERAYSDDQLRVVAVIENLQREDISAADEVAAVAGLASHMGTKDAAAAIGRKSQYVSKMVKIAKSSDRVQELLSSGHSTDLAAFYELALLHGKDAEAAEKIIRRWLEEPKQQVSLRGQVAEARARLDGKEPPKKTGVNGGDDKEGSSKSGKKKKTDFVGHTGFEPDAFHIEKVGNTGRKVVFELTDGSNVEVTFSSAEKWSGFVNEINS